MAFLDLFFPKRCLGCRKEGCYFCSVCQAKIKTLELQICPVCGKPAINGQTHPFCQKRYALDGLLSVFPYEGMIKSAVIKLKYKFITDLADELAILIIKNIKAHLELQFKYLNHLAKEEEKITLVPIPLHWRRKNWRGFNQAELLGKKLAGYFGWQLQSYLLRRQKHVRPQVKLTGDERQQNVQGAFAISSGSPTADYPLILLFDDVWTTGSTLKEAGRVLKKAGFKKVWGLTIAR
jgi:competence protein ComFC